MAYLTQKGTGRWELRESVRTERGPRSRTLVSFDELTADVLERAAARATRPFDAEAVRAAARRAAVPVARPRAEQAARTLASELTQGATISPALAGVLTQLLGELETAPVSEAATAAAQWADASSHERGAALVDLLLLGDALPAPRTVRDEPTPRLLVSAPGAGA